MIEIFEKIESIESPPLLSELQKCVASKTAPAGALGEIAEIGIKIGQILGTASPQLKNPQLIVFAADHGIAAQGVSAYPQEVTWQMVHNFLAGGAAVSVIARQHGIKQTVVDCGVAHEFTPQEGLIIKKIAHGTKDFSQTSAMTIEQCKQAIENGAQIAKSLDTNIIAIGEMGIANTSSASCLFAKLENLEIAEVTGAGTGLNSAGISHKAEILRRALKTNEKAQTPLEILAALGGFEIATMCGAILQAASQRRVIIIDGFISSAAALVASKIAPNALERCIFAHKSNERGHEKLLQILNARPVLSLNLRLGEASGAALAYPILNSACKLLCEMASFESAGVSNK